MHFPVQGKEWDIFPPQLAKCGANALTYRMCAWVLSQLNQAIQGIKMWEYCAITSYSKWAVHDLIILPCIILTCGPECQILEGGRQGQLHFWKEISNIFKNHRGRLPGWSLFSIYSWLLIFQHYGAMTVFNLFRIIVVVKTEILLDILSLTFVWDPSLIT